MSLPQIESSFTQAAAERRIPGTILCAATRDGSFEYVKSFGNASLEPDAGLIDPNAILSIASSSKLVTNIAVVQLIQKGLITLITHIADVLPRWKNPQILIGFEDGDHGTPILKPAQSQITLAQLLTHTSGISFLEDERIQQYHKAIGNTHFASIIERYFGAPDLAAQEKVLPEMLELMGRILDEPLLFEPGTGWVYGYGQDWGGQLLEKLTGQTLEQYAQEHIFKPLGMQATFRYGDRPEIEARLVPLCTRTPDAVLQPALRLYPGKPETDMGGSGLCCSAPDFLKLLTSLLRKDGKILDAAHIDLLLNYRLPDRSVFEPQEVRDDLDMLPGITLDHCLAGLVNLDPSPTGRSPGSACWAGASGTFWWIDSAAGVCGFYGSCVFLARDQKISHGMFEDFEKAVYDHIRS